MHWVQDTCALHTHTNGVADEDERTGVGWENIDIFFTSILS
jgi:hypothetical protein